MPGLLQDVKTACAEVATSARWVTISHERLIERASRLGAMELTLDPDPAYSYLGEPEDMLAWVLTFTAVNFGSGWHPHVRKLPGRSGSITMMSRLRDRFLARGPLVPGELAEVGPDDCAKLFGQELISPVDELMVLFSQALNDLGRLILERYDGSFTVLDRLMIFADNLIPHVLRVDGVLRFDPELLDLVQRGQLLPSGSEPEVEIRAVALHAVELMVAEAHRRDQPATAAGIDHLLWVTGQQPRYKASPRHRCRTTYY